MNSELLELRAKAFDYLFDAVVVIDSQGIIIDWNKGSEDLYGYTKAEIIGKHVSILHVPEDIDRITDEVISAVTKSGKWTGEVRMQHKTGRTGWVESMCMPLFDDDNQVIGTLGINRNITERKQAELRDKSRAHVLELITRGEPLPVILEAIARIVEQENPAMLCSILILDDAGKHLLKGTASSLPDFYTEAIHGLEIGMGVGSCGTAAFINERVIVDDIQTHPYWAPFKELARKAKLGACWSEPIRSTIGGVLGTFAIYHHDVNYPTEYDLAVIEQTARLASIAIEKKQTEEALWKSNALFSQSEAMGNMGHWTWDLVEDKLISCSDQFARIYDMTVPEALDYFISSDAVTSLIHPDDKKHFKQIVNFKGKQYKGLDTEYRLMTLAGNTRHIYERSELVLDSDGAPSQSFGTVQDITDFKKIESKLSYQASYDALTGLFNRSEFEQHTNNLLATTQKTKAEHAMCFLDLDQFKVINDTCGHFAGDELLRQLGMLLRNSVRQQDTVARLGGDEFGVLMEHCTLDQAHRGAGAILDAIKEYQFSWEGKTFRVGVSIGLIAITETSGNYTDMFKQADAACYMAKELGRNRIHVYHPDDVELAVRQGEMQWVGRINQALDENRFYLYAQPIVSLDNDNLRHYELLVRMLGEQDEIIPPGAFLPAAERYNLIERIDTWVVEHAISLMNSHPALVEQVNFISINLSGQSLTNAQFMPMVIDLIAESNVDASKICFEITETAAISNLLAASTFIAALKDLGCRFALDDFGSGLSSFGYLKNLPVDYLKIDGMFVKDMVDDPIDKAMVKSINDIGHVMGMKTIAEFVENDAIMEQLKEVGVDYVQGYGIGKPVPFHDVISRFEDHF